MMLGPVVFCEESPSFSSFFFDPPAWRRPLAAGRRDRLMSGADSAWRDMCGARFAV
jgi:hypothetical protein